MSVKRIVSTGFWDDSKVADVFSPEDKYFMLYLLTNPHTTQLGVYELSISKAAYELGYSKEAVKVLLDRFEKKYGIIQRSDRTGEIAILNYLRHSIIKGGKPVYDCLAKEASNVTDRELLYSVAEHISQYSDTNPTALRFFEDLLAGEREKEAKRERVELLNDKDNDNDNERYVVRNVVRNVDVTSKPSGKKIPPSLDEVREYIAGRPGCPVDPEQFYDYYESVGWFIGKSKMKNWHSAVGTWERKRGYSVPKADSKNNNAAAEEMPAVEKPISLEEWLAGGDDA